MLEPTTANKTQSSGISQSDVNPTKSKLGGLVQGIHDRVSAYVLLKVEKQIEQLIDIEENLNTEHCYKGGHEQTYTNDQQNIVQTDSYHDNDISQRQMENCMNISTNYQAQHSSYLYI